MEGYARELIAKVQQMRKAAGLTIEDVVDVYVEFLSETSKFHQAFRRLGTYIDEKLGQPLLSVSQLPASASKIVDETKDVVKESVRLVITRRN